MRVTPQGKDPLYEQVEPVVRGLGMSLVELSVARPRPAPSRREAEPGPARGSRKTRRRGGKRGEGEGPEKASPPVKVRVVVYKSGPSGGPPSLDECSRIHHAILPRLELAFPGADLFVEVSSPGIDRLIKDPAELGCYVGRGIRCYRTGTAEWVGGVLQSSDGAELRIKTQDGTITVPYAHIGKVKLDYSQEV